MAGHIAKEGYVCVCVCVGGGGGGGGGTYVEYGSTHFDGFKK